MLKGITFLVKTFEFKDLGQFLLKNKDHIQRAFVSLLTTHTWHINQPKYYNFKPTPRENNEPWHNR